MITRSEPVRNRFDTIQTISSVITAVCLFVLTISLLVAGSYTVTTVNKLQSTYHPEKLASIISDASDTMSTIHKTTSMLKSSRGEITIFDDVERLIKSIEDLSQALQTLKIPNVLNESQAWRHMSEHALLKLKETFSS